MSSDLSCETRPRRVSYGNWVPLRSPGLCGHSLAATVIGLGGLVASVIALGCFGLTGGLITGAASVGCFVLVGTPVGPTMTRRVAFWAHQRAGGDVFVSGAFSPNAAPDNRLPGMLSRTRLLEHDAPSGQRFAVVHDPRKGGLYTVVACCAAEGPGMCDPEQVDAAVAGWARLLAAVGAEPGVVCLKAITDTAPDPGDRLARVVQAARTDGSPALARAVMDECAAAYPATASTNLTWVEVTFKGNDLAPDSPGVLAELSRRVPGLLAGLAEAGGGSVWMATGPELAHAVRLAYDPTIEQNPCPTGDLGADEIQGLWADAGPVAAVEGRDSYRHDGAVSVSWELTEGPRAPISATAFAALLAPHPDLARKRVAIIHRPHTRAKSTRIAENDAAAAVFNAGGDGRRRQPSATHLLRARATEASRHDIAAGAVLTRFTVLVTATVTDPTRLPAATAAVVARAGCVPIRMRCCQASQAAAFATTLPVGFVPWEHTFFAERVRELM